MTPEVWLQDRLGGRPRRSRFHDCAEIVRCVDPAGFSAALDRIGALSRAGYHLAGYLSYEAGYLVEETLAPLLPATREVPLVWMGAFREREEIFPGPRAPSPSFSLSALEPEQTRDDYTRTIERILEYIRAGDIYQANYTFRSDVSLAGNPRALFDALTLTQPVPYGAYLETGDEVILSLSPELFFETRGRTIRTRPMKGTAKRGRTLAEDKAAAECLAGDPKERAENLMILDLMRNDLSRISETGSVKVPERFAVERYRTVLQMTSTAEATLEKGAGFGDILRAIFPCGSVTGAPKIRAMEIIRDLEQSPRGVYCGAIGHIAPDGDATFNVAIRTLTFHPQGPDAWRGKIGVGGGIVHDSTPEREYEECRVKLSFLDNPQKEPVSLIETMSAEDGKIWLFDRHLARLEASADYFDYPFDQNAVEEALQRRCGRGMQRLRLLLHADGSLEATSTPLALSDGPIRFSIADTTIDTANPFLYHKTTRRQLYDETWTRENERLGVDEVLFLNEHGELAEGSRSTLFLRFGDRWLTPPFASGCLPGTLRAHLLTDPGFPLEEQSLDLGSLEAADEICFGNSVRGLQRAVLLQEAIRAVGE